MQITEAKVKVSEFYQEYTGVGTGGAVWHTANQLLGNCYRSFKIS